MMFCQQVVIINVADANKNNIIFGTKDIAMYISLNQTSLEFETKFIRLFVFI